MTRRANDTHWRRAGRACLRLLVVGVLMSWTPSCRNLNLFSRDQDVKLGEQAYADIRQQSVVIETGPDAEMVHRVTNRLVEVAAEQEPWTTEVEFSWNADLIESEQVNAFCLPGGKMAVYTGILPLTQTETGLAVVMGHEIAHATQRHGTEKMTRSLGVELLATLARQYGSGPVADPELVDAFASGVIHLPYGREDEMEADRVGLRYMAAAGYDPREAIEFWKRMAALSQGGGPEWMSTHPSDERRIAQIEELLPEALLLYEAARARPTAAP